MRVDHVDYERKCIHVVVPAWDTRVKVQINFDNLPENIKTLAEPDHRFHARVNTGALDSSDLYFYEWEER